MSATEQHHHQGATDLDQGLRTLFADDTFHALERQLDQFSPFRVLKVERYELRHTTTLSWLLDPHGTHRMGDRFLQCFMRTVAPPDAPFWAGANTDTAEVQAELVFDQRRDFTAAVAEETDPAGAPTGERLDVLIEGRNGKDVKWCVAIEAKIDSKEGIKQLPRYDRWLEPTFAGHHLLRLYLTVDPVEAVPGGTWTNILWGEHVAQALDATLAQMHAENRQLEPKVASFIEDYRELLSGLSHGNNTTLIHLIHAFANRPAVGPVLRQLKRALANKTSRIQRWDDDSWVKPYWDHRALLNLCVARVRSADAAYLWDLVVNEYAAGDDWHIIPTIANTNTINFVPASWLDMPAMRSATGQWNFWYHAEFREKDVEVKLHVPGAGDRVFQRAVVRQLFPKGRPAFAHFKADAGKLESFLDAGASLKLYSVKRKWVRVGDVPCAVPAEIKGKNQPDAPFPTIVAAHTAALSAAFASQ